MTSWIWPYLEREINVALKIPPQDDTRPHAQIQAWRTTKKLFKFWVPWGHLLAPLSFTASKTFNCEPVCMLCDDLSRRITCQHTHTRFHRGPLRALTPITKPNNTPLHIHHSWIWLHIWFIYLFSDGTSLSLFSLVNNSIKMSTTALLYINIMCNKASGREQVCTGTMGRGRRVNTQPSQQPNTI